MKAVITKVWPKNERGPGSVVFSDGTKLSTFSDAILGAAEGLIGQMVEYTTERKGQYTNLASVTAVAGASEQRGATKPVQSPPPAAVDLAMRKSAERIADALESIAASLVQLANPRIAYPVDPSTSGADDPTDPIMTAQAKLAKAVGDDAAAAMFEALKRKHKKPDALAKAADELLQAHATETGGAA
jgi:uncharacterized protein (DUF2236 family)